MVKRSFILFFALSCYVFTNLYDIIIKLIKLGFLNASDILNIIDYDYYQTSGKFVLNENLASTSQIHGSNRI